MEFKINDLLNDSNLSMEDKDWVLKFQFAVKEFLGSRGFTPELSLFTIAISIGLDVTTLNKEGILLYALWVVFLSELDKYITEADYKYPTVESFLEAYAGRFSDETESEKRCLWTTANWMNILFRIITARKNKGLVIQVLPKLIEGWDSKYVTGSGQTKATANRVHLFETEGNTKANHRGKMKAKKKSASASDDGEEGEESPVDHDAKPRKKRARVQQQQTQPKKFPSYTNTISGLSAVTLPSMNGSFAFTEPFGTVGRQRGARAQYVGSNASGSGSGSGGSRRSSGGVDAPGLVLSGAVEMGSSVGGEVGLNDDVKKTFAAWQEATENYGLGLLNLSRSNSFVNNGLARNVEQQLTDPMDYQRGFSWTEIPTTVLGGRSESTMSVGALHGGNVVTRAGSVNNGLGLGSGAGTGLGMALSPSSAFPMPFPPPEDAACAVPLAAQLSDISDVTAIGAVGSGSGGFAPAFSDGSSCSSKPLGSVIGAADILDMFKGYGGAAATSTATN
jgi:hypothetical protein